MCYEKDCYFCKHLCYFDINNVNAYFCTLTGTPYQKTKLIIQCENFSEEMVE